MNAAAMAVIIPVYMKGLVAEPDFLESQRVTPPDRSIGIVIVNAGPIVIKSGCGSAF